jgi:hypothetical protein
LHGFELFQNGTGCQARCFDFGPLFQGDLQAVTQEADENVCLDPVVFLMIDRADVQIVFEFFEGLFDFGEYDVLFPKFFRTSGGKIGAQQVCSFTAAGLPQFFAV